MEAVRQYLVSVVAVCMITVPAIVFVRKESLQKTVRLIGGVLILLVAIRPLLHIDLKDLSEQFRQFTKQYEFDSDKIENDAKSQLAASVINGTENVIEQKATELGGILQARVTVSDGELPVPIHVKLIGSMPLDKIDEMKDFLCSAIQIPLEEQEWDIYGPSE